MASGQGERMLGKDKIFSQINGSPLVSYSIKVFDSSPFIDRIVLVVSSQNIRMGMDILAKYGSSKSSDVCTGGQRRQDSVRYGLQKLVDVEWVVVEQKDNDAPYHDSPKQPLYVYPKHADAISPRIPQRIFQTRQLLATLGTSHGVTANFFTA